MKGRSAKEALVLSCSQWHSGVPHSRRLTRPIIISAGRSACNRRVGSPSKDYNVETLRANLSLCGQVAAISQGTEPAVVLCFGDERAMDPELLL